MLYTVILGAFSIDAMLYLQLKADAPHAGTPSGVYFFFCIIGYFTIPMLIGLIKNKSIMYSDYFATCSKIVRTFPHFLFSISCLSNRFQLSLHHYAQVALDHIRSNLKTTFEQFQLLLEKIKMVIENDVSLNAACNLITIFNLKCRMGHLYRLSRK